MKQYVMQQLRVTWVRGVGRVLGPIGVAMVGTTASQSLHNAACDSVAITIYIKHNRI